MARAWSDDEFRKRLETSPAEVLQEYGLPGSMKISIPPKPADLGEESVADVVSDVYAQQARSGRPSVCTF